MRIGVLTYHRAHNYGAMLQAYALLSFLRNHGYHAELIDYWPISHKNQYALIKAIVGTNFIYKVKNTIADICTFWRRYRRIQGFQMFENRYLNLPRGIKYTNANALIDTNYDCVIAGSDQIWRNRDSNNNHIGFDSTYFCQNIRPTTRCISYAASMGIIQLSENDKVTLKQYLKRFSTILVRENTLNELVHSLGFQAQVVLDPTLLLTKEQWNLSLPKERFSGTRYVLYYELMPSKEAMRFAQEKAHSMGCKLLVMDARIPIIPKLGHLSYASPIEFMHAIRDAEYVIATSFHGTAFSIIFEKQFLTIGLKKNADRVITLLSHLGIIEHYQENPVDCNDIDYCKIKTRYNNLVTDSQQKLLTAIEP